MNLKELRMSKRLSQIEFGEKLGWSQHRVSRLESGRQEFVQNDQDQITEAFGVEVDVVRNLTPYAPTSVDERDREVMLL